MCVKCLLKCAYNCICSFAITTVLKYQQKNVLTFATAVINVLIYFTFMLNFRYVTSWLETRVNSTEKSHLVMLFDKYIPSCLENMRTRFKKITPITEMAHIQMLCHLLQCLLTPANTPPGTMTVHQALLHDSLLYKIYVTDH